MSHYTVLVAIDPTNPERRTLEAALAPFDENTEVEPYRVYEEGDASGYWLYSSLKRAAQHVADGTGILPYEPNSIGYSNRASRETPGEQLAKLQADADAFHALPDPVRWADVVKLHAERYGDDCDRLYLAEDGRAYTVSTYSKLSRWDWWQTGGRWTGWFQVRPEYVGHPGVINGKPGTMTAANTDPDKCDGGPKRVLDLARTRDWAQVDEAENYAKFQKLVEGTPEAELWSSFIARHEADKAGYPIDWAREVYHAQPRVQALKGTDFDFWTADALERFQRPREEVLARAAARAVPGFATLTLDGQWKEPGEMGWFGMSTDTPETQDEYYAWANEYVDSLDDEIVLVLVDVHI
jgi:hypothetical protein